MKKSTNLWIWIFFLSLLQRSVYCVMNKSCFETTKDFVPSQDYFLPYMTQLKHNYSSKMLNTTTTCYNDFANACKTQPHSYSYFNKMVYSILCADISTPGDKSCSKYIKSSAACIRGYLDCPILCVVIFMYLQYHNPLDENYTASPYIYKEVILEDVPFCNSITCPSLESKTPKNKSLLLSAYEGMPQSCQIGFWIILIVDVILSFLIAVTNGIVILVGTKYTLVRFSGG